MKKSEAEEQFYKDYNTGETMCCMEVIKREKK